MKVALIYPPTCDPTAPYISVPLLTAVLRREGVETTPIDANIEAYDRLLRGVSLKKAADRAVARLNALERKISLGHEEQLLLGRLRDLDVLVSWAPDNIEDAVGVLRDKTGKLFFDPSEYEKAVFTVEAGLRIVGAAFGRLEMDFTRYRTPFSLLSMERIKEDARPENNPFHEYFANDLREAVSSSGAHIVGVSMAFPGQIQPGFALAYEIAAKMPGVYLAAGGPALTQIFARLDGDTRPEVLGPFHSVVLYEGEKALLDMVRTLESGKKPPKIVCGDTASDLSELPPPDFDGLPLEKYLSPEPVLPYDVTRGCYWGKCAFCQYGLGETGTARYRKRPVDRIASHLKDLKERWNCRVFYFSQDAFDPKTARQVSRAFREERIGIKWGSDMRPEPALTPGFCRELADGGALALSLGIESAAPRVLKSIHKGIGIETMRAAIENISEAGIAAEAMCFTDFPGETAEEAVATLNFIDGMRKRLALFICGRFGLCAGSLVARFPERYGVENVRALKGDQLKSGLFYEERRESKSDGERQEIDERVDELSGKWRLRDYPWAGALSTAHTLLWYDRYGPDIFKRLAEMKIRFAPPVKPGFPPSRFDFERIVEIAEENEARIWAELIRQKEAVGPELYRKLAQALPRQFARVARAKKIGKRGRKSNRF